MRRVMNIRDERRPLEVSEWGDGDVRIDDKDVGAGVYLSRDDVMAFIKHYIGLLAKEGVSDVDMANKKVI